MSDLPPGFVLDQPPAPPSINGLPLGFVLDSQPQTQRTAGYQPGQFWHNAGVESKDFTDPIVAAGHNFMNPIHGTAQLIEHGLGAAGIEPQSAVSRDDAAMVAREKQYQASVPDNFANDAGAIIGGIAPYVASGLGAGLNKVGSKVASYLPEATPVAIGNAASGATQGALVGAISPIDNTTTPYSDQKTKQIEIGGALGAVVPTAISAGQAIYKGGKAALQPILQPNQIVGKALSEWAGNDPETLAKLRAVNEIIPGSSPTTAQVIANPDIVQAEKALAGNPQYKGQFMNRDIANNQARLDAIQQIAGSPDAIQQAIKDRSAAVAEWVGSPATENSPAMPGKLKTGAPVPIQPIIDSLNNLQNAPLSLRPTVGAASKDILSDLQNRSFQGTNNAERIKSGPRLISPGDLNSIRQNARDYLAKYAPNGAVSSQQEAAFVPVKNAITDAIEQANPGYRNYLATFAKSSVPINTMEAAQGILENVNNRTANATGAPQLNLSNFNSQLAKALNTPYGISPEGEGTLNNIAKDLQRGTISNSVRTPGSDTNYNLQAPGWIGKQLYGPEFGGPGKAVKTLATIAGGLAGAGGGVMGAGAAAGGGYAGANYLANTASKHVNSLLADALLNPSKAADMIEAYQAAQTPKNAQISDALLKRLPQLGGLIQ